MQIHLSHYYDIVNREKNYVGEVEFLRQLFMENNLKSVFDIGCGIGIYMELLEKAEYIICTGTDINQEILDVAKNRVNDDFFTGSFLFATTKWAGNNRTVFYFLQYNIHFGHL